MSTPNPYGYSLKKYRISWTLEDGTTGSAVVREGNSYEAHWAASDRAREEAHKRGTKVKSVSHTEVSTYI